MKYPMIYSLSTIGILKHYNQDYPIHEQRTDFTGANGVGKSIIADLFQLIFINDKQLFQFGTEGYDKEGRQIYKLPYECRDAYAFLSIQVSAGKFICIGVCIPNSSNRPLKPFLISADPNPQHAMTERAFSVEKLPMAKHFINDNNQIQVVEDLGRSFRDRFDLYFEYYSNRDQKDEHYARLYDQRILPIDLSTTSNLKAFSKIIQSFSRVRSSGDKSEELKDFLFEGVQKEFEQSFDAHKADIDKLLQDYQDLQTFIADLEAKMETLNTLNGFADTQHDLKKTYLLSACGFSLTLANHAKSACDRKIAEYDEAVEKSAKLAKSIPQLQRISGGYSTMLSDIASALETITVCLNLKAEIKKLDEQIHSFTLDDLPVIRELFDSPVDIDDYEDKEIIKRCLTLTPLYGQYGSLAAIGSQIQYQKEEILKRQTSLKNQINYLELVNHLFSDSEENSLIAEVLNSKLTIAPAQEAVLFHFLEAYWQKPEVPGVPFFALGFDFFKEENIEPDQLAGGYWLKSEDFYVHIPALDREPVLGDPALRKNAINELLELNRLVIEAGKAELAQLRFFEKGEKYDADAIPFLKSLDGRLYDYGVLQECTISAQLVAQLDGKTEALQVKRAGLSNSLATQLNAASLSSEDDLELLFKQKSQNQNCWQKRESDFKELLMTDTSEEKSLRLTVIPNLDEQVKEKKTVVDRTWIVYLADRTSLETTYPELITEQFPEVNEDQLRNIKNELDTATLNYKSRYLTACERFPETAAGNNLELAAEINEGRYNFFLLESALLGSKIRFSDHITEELTSANRSRKKLVDSIHETMLKIFVKTKNKYEEFRTQIRELNLFFKGRTISKKYFFQVDFRPSEDIPIDWINQLQSKSQFAYDKGELQLGDSIEVFIEKFFKDAVSYHKKIGFRDLLDPRSYFTLKAGLVNADGKEIPGSTGETYSAKVLLGIGRLSRIQSQTRDGIRFIILEETANLDNNNFNNFPAIAEQYGYQIITMTPKPFGGDATDGWYLHHLLPGKDDPDINYPVPASYFKTNTEREMLRVYLKRKAL